MAGWEGVFSCIASMAQGLVMICDDLKVAEQAT